MAKINANLEERRKMKKTLLSIKVRQNSIPKMGNLTFFLHLNSYFANKYIFYLDKFFGNSSINVNAKCELSFRYIICICLICIFRHRNVDIQILIYIGKT